MKTRVFFVETACSRSVSWEAEQLARAVPLCPAGPMRHQQLHRGGICQKRWSIRPHCIKRRVGEDDSASTQAAPFSCGMAPLLKLHFVICSTRENYNYSHIHLVFSDIIIHFTAVLFYICRWLFWTHRISDDARPWSIFELHNLIMVYILSFFIL